MMRISHEHFSSRKSQRIRWDESLKFYTDDDVDMDLAEIGNWIVTRVAGRGGFDGKAAFKGLPHEMCQSPHYGMVVKGRVQIATPDGPIICEAGDAYYQAVPHRVEWLEDSVLIEFSPREEFWITQKAVEDNSTNN